MELVFQLWDELDDAVAAMRHVLGRYGRNGLTRALGAVNAALSAPPRYREPRGDPEYPLP